MKREDYIRFDHVKKTYHVGEVDIHALQDVSFSIKQGEFVIIAGASGAGKSTILNILGGMDTCSAGEISVDERRIDTMDEKALTDYRRYDIGFVFQFYNLVQNLTAMENVELAVEICKNHLDPSTVLRQVGLQDRMHNFPSQLSGGEQQRVAIARALAKKPKLLLCDEPTGALDYITGKQILKLLHDMCVELSMTVVIITHNLAICPMGDRVIQVKNGRIVSNEINANPVDIDRIEW